MPSNALTIIQGDGIELNVVQEDYSVEIVAVGLSAYQIAVENGYTDTEAAWLASLHGADGVGKSAYEVYEDTVVPPDVALTEAEWLESLKGEDAYALAVQEGYIGTLTEWLAGTRAYNIAVQGGFTGTEAEFNDILYNIGQIPTALDLIIGD